MSAVTAASAVTAVVEKARERDQAAARAEVARWAAVQRANADAGRKRALAQKRALETREMAKKEKAEGRKAMEDAKRNEQQRKQEEARLLEKERRKAVKLATKPPPRTKPVSKTITSMPHTRSTTQALAPAPTVRRIVIGSELHTTTPTKRNKSLDDSRLMKWLAPTTAAVLLQNVWRKHRARQLLLLLAYKRKAAKTAAAFTIQRLARAKLARGVTKTTMHCNEKPVASNKPRKKCRYHPCTKSYCWFAHEPRQQLTDRRAAQADGASMTECFICFEPIATSDLGALPCGHAGHHKCMVAAVEATSSCPTCRLPCSGGAVIKIRV